MNGRMKVWSGLFLILTAAVLSANADAQSSGKVRRNVYYPPADNFSVPVPSGLGMRVSDAYFKRDGFGVLSFHDDFGMQRGIHYVSLPEDGVRLLQALDDPAEMLLNWLHDVAMPTWFLQASPASTVLREAGGDFEGVRAAFGLVQIPGGSPLTITTNGVTSRLDSRRGVIVFQRGSWVYMLTIETLATGWGVANRTENPEPSDQWQASLAESLGTFYRTITFED